MTAVALMCWRCRNKTNEAQYCPMMEELQEEREFCRQMLFEDTLEDCGDDLCEACQRECRGLEFGDKDDEYCSGFVPMSIDRFK